MKTDHLSAWQQEEYIVNRGAGEQAPEVLRHLVECDACRAEVGRLEHGVAIFRRAGVEWSAQCLATRPQPMQSVSSRRISAATLRWGLAAAIPVVALLLLLLPLHLFHPSGQPIARPAVQISAAQISDDALLDQVDEQVSVTVPSSMESLTHLVSASSSGTATATAGSKHLVQSN